MGQNNIICKVFLGQDTSFLVFPFTQKTKNLLFFSFSVKIPIFVSVLKVKQSHALKLVPLPNRYQLPGLSLFTLYQAAD